MTLPAVDNSRTVASKLWPPESRDTSSLLDRVLSPEIVIGLLSILAIAHYLYLLLCSHQIVLGFIPDDAFYELQLARHFIRTGVWSFDGGHTTTTGFHLLNVYLMSISPELFLHPWIGIKFWMGIGLVLSLSSIFVICRFTARSFGAFSLLAVFLLLSSRLFTINGTGLL